MDQSDGNARRQAGPSIAWRNRASVQGPLLDQFPAQDAFDGGTAENA
jgi:hypothetical protein